MERAGSLGDRTLSRAKTRAAAAEAVRITAHPGSSSFVLVDRQFCSFPFSSFLSPSISFFPFKLTILPNKGRRRNCYW